MAYSDLLQPFNIFGSSPAPQNQTTTPVSTLKPQGMQFPLAEGVKINSDGTVSKAPTPAVATAPATALPPAPKNPTAAPAPVPTYSFLDGSKYNASGKQIAPPTVITAKPAIEDLANKQAALTQAQQAQTLQQQNLATTATATPTTTAKPPATVDDLDKIINGEQSNPANDALKEVQQAAEDTYRSFTEQISQIMNGTFPLTPAQQAQITATQNSFNQLKAQQDLLNKNFVGQIRVQGAVSGRNMTAPALDASLIHQALSAGVQQIASIDTQASKAVADLQQGFMDKDYQMINDAYDRANQLFTQKSNVIQQMNENVRNATNDALALHKQKLDEQQKVLDNQRVAVDFAVKNGIKKPFYLIGNTAFDSKTGLPVDLPTFQQMTGQQVGLPEDQTDFSQIQTLTDPAVNALRNDYPDAGISPTDSIEEAQSKLPNSAIYRKQTHIDSGGGGGLSNAMINATINQIAGSFDNEPIVKQYNTIAETVNAVKTAGSSPTDDIQRIYAVAKVLDPNSAVREGEYKTVQDYATSLLQRSGLKAKRVFSNTGFLTDEARQFINTTLDNRLKSSKANYDNVYKQYQNRIENAKAGNFNSLTDYSQAFLPEVPAGNVLVIAPDGTQGYIPQDQLEEALKSGYKQP